VGLFRGCIKALTVLVVAAGMAGCSGGDSSTSISASDKIFAGLDSAVVLEVIESKAAKERVSGDEPAVAAARYQGMVRNFIACRSALNSYQKWITSGVAGEFPEQPTPTHPAATAADMDKDIETFKSDLASGDITLLRDHLSNPTGCGSWIPAKARDESGPTIADVVKGKA
jgi:hypothetical protein